MPAYLLIVAAVLSRLIPHSDWLGFTAVGGSLLYFGARRRWQEMLAPVALFALVDYYLTTRVYAYDFHLSGYLLTWAWYAMAIALGRILLADRVTFSRGIAASLLGPTSFFLASNFAVWVASPGMYTPDLKGLATCYVAGLPFYTRDLISTGLVVAVAFGAPILLRRYLDRTATETL
jgi:hypothetical protein